MIQMIRLICRNAGCEPKDLIVEWSPTTGARVVVTNRQGVRSFVKVPVRLDQIAQAIWLCANGQEELYPQAQQQQMAIDSTTKEWRAFGQAFEDPAKDTAKGSSAIHIEGAVKQDWRQSATVLGILRAFPRRPSSDDLIDLYQRNKALKSSRLKALLEKHSR
jgi:hypothetical protein